MNLHFSVHAFDLLDVGQFHSVLPEPFLPSVSDISNLFHGLDGFDVHFSIVLDGFVTFFFEFEDGVVGKLFAMEFSVGFGPGEFSGVVFGFEVFVALGSAELEDFAVVADESHAMAWVDRP